MDLLGVQERLIVANGVEFCTTGGYGGFAAEQAKIMLGERAGVVQILGRGREVETD